MDFWSHQDRAKAHSGRFVLLFILAVLAVVAAFAGLAWEVASRFHLQVEGRPITPLEVTTWTTVVVLAVILIGALVKSRQLSQGGIAVAHLLGGREARRDQPAERRLLDVTEEMSIASGHPMPAVFILDQSGINAFAAGYTSQDAAIAVTKGAVEGLTRDELQAVVAHEFSHLLHGDARLNLRLVGWLHGLLAIVLIGRVLLEGGTWSGTTRRHSKDQGGAVALIGIALVLLVIGGIGWIAASLIRAAISRNREFLADAAGAQFTRNPAALASALARIREQGDGSGWISHRSAAEVSHFFFVRGLSRVEDLFGSHPPLDERIRRLDPGWDAAGRRPPALVWDEPTAAPRTAGPAVAPPLFPATAGAMAMAASGVPLATATAHLSATGRQPAAITPERVAFARHLLDRLPGPLLRAAEDPFQARAVILLLVMPRVVSPAVAVVEQRDRALAQVLVQLLPACQGLAMERVRLALFNHTRAALRQLTPAQARELHQLARAVAASDGAVDLRDLVLLSLLRSTLAPPSQQTPRYHAWKPVLSPLATVFDALARSAGSEFAQQSWQAGFRQLGLDTSPTRPAVLADGPTLAIAIDQLAQCNPGMRRRMLAAAAHAIAADGEVRPVEAELLHLLAERFQCPLPPFADG